MIHVTLLSAHPRSAFSTPREALSSQQIAGPEELREFFYRSDIFGKKVRK
jgi:hypothetical protein